MISGDDIWEFHGKLERMINRSDGDVRKVLTIALQAIATAGTMADVATIKERDRNDTKTTNEK